MIYSPTVVAAWICLISHSIVSTTLAQPQLEVSEDANYIAIDGWWSQCGNHFDASSDIGCKGTLAPVEPSPIDVTGNTCYINPRATTVGIEHMVYWFSTQQSSTGVTVVYYSWYMPFSDLEEFYPTECTAGGACFCGTAFEQLRAGWNLTDSSGCFGTGAIATPETHDCATLGFQPLENKLKPKACAAEEVMFRIYSETNPGSSLTNQINACALAASFTSMAPTVSPAPTSPLALNSPAPTTPQPLAPTSSTATMGIGMMAASAVLAVATLLHL